MFTSLKEGIRSLLSVSTNDQKRSSGIKRKRSCAADQEEEDPDVHIIKVEKKRKLDSHNSFWSIFHHLPTKMSDWLRPKPKVFSDQFNAIDTSRRSNSREALSNRNGIPTRTIHNRSKGHDAIIQQHRGAFPVDKRDYGEGQIINDVNTSQLNGERRSSTSSWSRQGHNYSAGIKCIRLKEREEYEKLLKLQTRLSSPSRIVEANKESDTFSISSSSGGDVSLLGTKCIFSQSRQSSNTSQHSPRYKSAHITFSRDISSHFQKYRPDDFLTKLLTNQRRRAGIEVPAFQTKSKSPEPETQTVESRRSTVESRSSHSKDSVVIIDDDDVVEADKGSKSEHVNQCATNGVMDRELSSLSQHKSLDFRDCAYMKPSYMEKLKKSRLMHCDQWRRQVEEEQMKARAYEQKRRAQNLELERRLKHQMRIFEEEPEVSEEIFIEKKEEKEEKLPELTESMRKVIHSALRPGNPGEVLSDGFRLQITRKDLATLAGLNWLNDEVINFYMNMLMERSEKEGMAKAYAFNTFFYPKIMQGGHSAVKRWTKKVDIFAMHYILIPVHLGMHWCICIVDMKDKCITYYDSMHGRNKDCLPAVLKYINDESIAKKQQPINTSEWKLVMAEDNPQQLNGSDCGMFSCKYAEYVTRGKDLTFTQEDMPYFRQRMVYEIITKRLLQ